mgnify:CR=1 FL=1
MGTKHSDSNLDIFIELDKPFYYTGEYVQGKVHIHAKAALSYTNLYLHYENKEYCRWSETYGRSTVTYVGKKQNFADEFILHQFPGGIPQGQYTFPFGFQLPAGLPGSFKEGCCKNFKIYYPVTAFMIDYQNPNSKPEFKVCATVIEPPRFPNQTNVRLKNIGNPKTCCCCDQGTSAIDVLYDTTTVKSGQPVRLTINVDNRQCKQNVKNVEVTLVQNKFVQSDYGVKRHYSVDKYLQKAAGVAAGYEGLVHAELDTSSVQDSAALGTIVANWYTVRAQAVVAGCICCPCCACCGNNYPTVEKDVYIDASSQLAHGPPQFSAPLDWSPAPTERIVYRPQTPPVFQPNLGLPLINPHYQGLQTESFELRQYQY